MPVGDGDPTVVGADDLEQIGVALQEGRSHRAHLAWTVRCQTQDGDGPPCLS